MSDRITELVMKIGEPAIPYAREIMNPEDLDEIVYAVLKDLDFTDLIEFQARVRGEWRGPE